MAAVDVQTLRNIYLEKFVALVNDPPSYRAWWAKVVVDDGDFDNHSLMNWYLNCSDIASIYDINDSDVRRCVGFAIQDNDLRGEFTDHLWEHDVYFDRIPLQHNDDDAYEQEITATDPQAPAAEMAEICDDPSTEDEYETEDEAADRLYTEYIELTQRNRWQGDD